MSTLFGSLSVGRQSLAAQQMGLAITQNNIANVNTPGYARQRANFAPGDGSGDTAVGAGVRLVSIESYRSRLLDIRVNGEIQRQGEYAASAEVLQQVEAFFDETTGTGLQSDISTFFNNFSSLANMPQDAALRQQVLAGGEKLGMSFRDTYEKLQVLRTHLDRGITEAVAEINSITAAIAKLNYEVVDMRGTMGNANSSIDERQKLVDRLASLVDINYFESESGSIHISTRQGALLVTGTEAHPWQVANGADGALRILAAGRDITDDLQSGRLGGLIHVRDTQITSYLAVLDDMAAAIISRVNAQHALGADAQGVAGGNFFVPFIGAIPGSNQGAARALEVAITDINKIAAADPAAGSGSNQNAKAIAGIQNELLLSGNNATLSEFYTHLVFRIGLDTKTGVDGMETQSHLLSRLQEQRDSQCGVSLDEEAINLMYYQKAFEASARFIALVDSLMDDMLSILGG